MTHTTPNEAPTESWAIYRRTFALRASYFPELNLIPRLIDHVVERGFASSLYASSSLDNLVISDSPVWDKWSRKIFVMPKKSTVEVRYYTIDAMVERCELSSEVFFEEIDRLLLKLLRERKQP
jgi:hypothetical protein